MDEHELASGMTRHVLDRAARTAAIRQGGRMDSGAGPKMLIWIKEKTALRLHYLVAH
jgi:hypothetical protein